VGEVHLIICLRKSMCESQSVIASIPTITFSFESVTVVADIVANTMPWKLFRTVATNLGETKNSHTLII